MILDRFIFILMNFMVKLIQLFDLCMIFRKEISLRMK